ncbi:hypothetical protein T265_15240, partial [Opisthorchis viverrini]
LLLNELAESTVTTFKKSVPSLVPAVKETTPPKCSTRYVRNSLHLTEDWNKKPFGDLFSASSPSSSSDTSDCF